MNAVGTHEDVQTLLHEAGHAFHAFEAFHLPYYQQHAVPLEFCEVASMSMEFLGAPYLNRAGGFYKDADAARARVEKLETSIFFWPYMAVTDLFQHWAYENPQDALDPENCDAQWGALWDRFMLGVDWRGLEQERVTGGHRKPHIFTSPFYYIEYGMAQLGAAQVWANARRDQNRAVQEYRRALALGATVPLPVMYETAGARFKFDVPTLKQAVALMQETINALEK
jgi:oligoendopeptidase F